MEVKQGIYARYIKRWLDVLLCCCILGAFWWLYLILIVLVRIRLGSPVFFQQDRPGKDGKVFRLYKFRTMTDARDASGALLPDRDRLTSFGRFLRKTSLDELPELFNILKGDMSFIGPRPLLVEYLPWYTEREQLRHSVRPGLTGLAQACGRNYLSWDKRFAVDVYYVEHLTFRMDCEVIVRTVQTVLGHSDEVAEDTNAAEGNFARIREALKESTGRVYSTEEPAKETLDQILGRH